jgi:hypothetical protein
LARMTGIPRSSKSSFPSTSQMEEDQSHQIRTK